VANGFPSKCQNGSGFHPVERPVPEASPLTSIQYRGLEWMDAHLHALICLHVFYKDTPSSVLIRNVNLK
jgi:hypothetical protein